MHYWFGVLYSFFVLHCGGHFGLIGGFGFWGLLLAGSVVSNSRGYVGGC